MSRFQRYHDAVPRCARCYRVLDLELACPTCDVPKKYECPVCHAEHDAPLSVAAPCLFCETKTSADAAE